MNALLQASTGRLTETQRAVSEHFQKGGSITAVLIVLSCLIAVILVVVLLTMRQRQADPNRVVNDPQRLYRDLLEKLGLAPTQQQFLQAIATDLDLPHPTVILLSSRLFDQRCGEWKLKGHARAIGLDASATDKLFAHVRTHLFQIESTASGG